MSRIDELQTKYPRIPRDVILKTDVTVQGVTGGGDLEKASDWTPASRMVYQSFDYDHSLKDLAQNKPLTVRPGYMLRPPDDMRFRSGLAAQTRLRSTSPFTIRELSEGNFALFEGEEKVEDIFFRRRKPRTTPEPVTSRGTPISELLELRPGCFAVCLMYYCQYFSVGEQCKFCNCNVSHADARAAGLEVPIMNNIDETVEAYKIRNSEVRQLEGFLMMGAFVRPEQETKVYLDLVEKLASASSNKPNLSVHTHAYDRKDLQRLKDVGASTFSIQLEVMDPLLFAEICPGKAKRRPYERWLEGFHDAVDIFGAGNVSGTLVPGVTLLSPNGHKSWQEARDYHIESNNWMIKNGALPIFLPMWWARGSVYSEDPSNVAKVPPTEYYLEVALAHHEAMLKYGLYDKMNKFMHCGLDCVGPYVGDIGMLTLAEDVGQWMSSVVPDELNWLARFIASAKSRTSSQI